MVAQLEIYNAKPMPRRFPRSFSYRQILVVRFGTDVASTQTESGDKSLAQLIEATPGALSTKRTDSWTTGDL
jgi:hypothetical protein